MDFSLEEIRLQYSKSSGPGGQHVNTTESRVTLSWNFASSRQLTTAIKDRLIILAGNRVSNSGWLQISSATFRSQKKNHEECFKKLKGLIAQARKVPKKRKKTSVPRSKKEERLKSKKKHSEIKKMRRKPSW